MKGPLLEVEDLTVRFHTDDGPVTAVEGASFAIERGETVGIVGESGSGKTVTFLAILGLLPTPPAEVARGRALFDGRDLLALRGAPLRAVRGRRIAMVFQDPMTALNPYLRIGRQLTEGMELHLGLSARDARTRAIGLLEQVGLPDPARRIDDWPHQLSGGMRQRVMIAMALACDPELLIADEPTTALDVTVQAQILDLLAGLVRERGMAMALVSHDLGVVAGQAERVLVMYGGRLVEEGPVEAIFFDALHPYTRGLLATVRDRGPNDGTPLATIPGSPPEPGAAPVGCPFRDRCARAFEPCDVFPEERRPAPRRRVFCHLVG